MHQTLNFKQPLASEPIMNMAKRVLLLDILGLIPLILCFLMLHAAAASPKVSNLSCSDHCGGIKISFPFGMGRSECFLDEWYEVDCKNGTVPFLKKLNLQVLNISFPSYSRITETFLTVNYPIIYSNPNCFPDVVNQPPSLKSSPFFFSTDLNTFAAVGCNVSARMKITNYSFVGCEIECSGGNFSSKSTCSGFDGCCHTKVPSGVQKFTVDFNNTKDDPRCNNYALLASESWLQQEFADLDSLKMKAYVPVILLWGILNGSHHAKLLFDDTATSIDPNASYSCFRRSIFSYDTVLLTCYCRSGYDGNAYRIDGCQDIDECKDSISNRCRGRCVNTHGSYRCVGPSSMLKFILIGIGSSLAAFLLVLAGWWLYRITKKRKEKKLKEKYFKRNGGLILQQQLISYEGNVLQGKLFSQKEMQMATENFSENRILGKEGQGTIYKGMLTDGRIVAIRKALVIDAEKVVQFINEVMILTQISHRNIVQLLGCCLESEIPLLVYEFIPKGNLYEYLHGSNKESVSWEVRLQLATEIAGALFYLHSAASIPVYHRDVKSTNILLDEKYQAKIADFGASRLVSLDQTHVTTLVQGTFGYLDPEFFQTTQFTDKSDVYSFRVVLVEFLTRQKPISTMRMEEGVNLAGYFILSIDDGHLFDILDADILNQGTEEEIMKVANLARRCLHIYGRNRPTMREVMIELEGIKKLRYLFDIQENEENHMQVQFHDIFTSASTRINVDKNVTTSLDAQPLLHGRTW